MSPPHTARHPHPRTLPIYPPDNRDSPPTARLSASFRAQSHTHHPRPNSGEWTPFPVQKVSFWSPDQRAAQLTPRMVPGPRCPVSFPRNVWRLFRLILSPRSPQTLILKNGSASRVQIESKRKWLTLLACELPRCPARSCPHPPPPTDGTDAFCAPAFEIGQNKSAELAQNKNRNFLTKIGKRRV